MERACTFSFCGPKNAEVPIRGEYVRGLKRTGLSYNLMRNKDSVNDKLKLLSALYDVFTDRNVFYSTLRSKERSLVPRCSQDRPPRSAADRSPTPIVELERSPDTAQQSQARAPQI